MSWMGTNEEVSFDLSKVNKHIVIRIILCSPSQAPNSVDRLLKADLSVRSLPDKIFKFVNCNLARRLTLLP